MGFIKTRVNDDELANDLLQEVFVKIHLHLPSLQDSKKLASWVYSISRNAIIDYYRKNKGEKEANIETKWLEEENNGLTKDFSRCVNSFLQEMDEKDRDILEKTTYGTLSQKEYAAKHQLSYSATKSRVQRARKKLKELFVECCNLQADKYGNIISSKEEDCNC